MSTLNTIGEWGRLAKLAEGEALTMQEAQDIVTAFEFQLPLNRKWL